MQYFVKRTVLLLVLLIGFAYAASAQTVYVTNTGKKYHEDGCRYLSKSKIKTTVKEAKASGYDACKVCKPPLATYILQDSELFAAEAQKTPRICSLEAKK